MAPFLGWADLPSELICHIGDHLGPKGYAGARSACTAWRRALAPLSPTLVFCADDYLDGRSWCHPYALSLPTRRSLKLTAMGSGVRFVGSSNCWLALSVVRSSCHTVFVLINPVARPALEIVLPPLIYQSRWTSKVVVAPSPIKDDFAAAAICDRDRIAYVTAGARRWAVTDPVLSTTLDHLTDVVYNDNGGMAAVYCLTMCGDVHVLRLPDRRLWKPAAANVDEAEAGPSPVPPKFSVLPRRRGKLMVWHYAREARTRYQLYDEAIDNPSLLSESQGPDLNFPATVEPLLSEANLPFDPATVFAPPYDILSSYFSAKNLVFCKGNLYQVWRNESCTITLQLPGGGGRRRVAEHEVLVLRYYPEQRPCWDAVKDLGGHSFFVGMNNALSMYAEGVPGLRGNSVYWIGGRGKAQGMVFDMESGRSTPCSTPPVVFSPRHPHRIICWYFL